MKKTLKLVPALAMLLVSAILVSTSTYAWFSMNSSVTATGMKVKAVSEGGIEIKAVRTTAAFGTTPTTAWNTTATADMATGIELHPTSNLAATASDGAITDPWYHASAAATNSFAAKTGTYAELKTVATKCSFTNGNASGNGVLAYESGVTDGAVAAGRYYLATTFAVHAVGAGATNLICDGVTVTGQTDGINFNKSLRVAVVCGSNIQLYAPISYSSDVEYKVITATTGTPMVLANGTMPTDNNVTAVPSSTDSGVLAATIPTGDTGVNVTIYIWFEGEDSNHFTDAFTVVDTLAVTVDFKATLS